MAKKWGPCSSVGTVHPSSVLCLQHSALRPPICVTSLKQHDRSSWCTTSHKNSCFFAAISHVYAHVTLTDGARNPKTLTMTAWSIDDPEHKDAVRNSRKPYSIETPHQCLKLFVILLTKILAGRHFQKFERRAGRAKRRSTPRFRVCMMETWTAHRPPVAVSSRFALTLQTAENGLADQRVITNRRASDRSQG